LFFILCCEHFLLLPVSKSMAQILKPVDATDSFRTYMKNKAIIFTSILLLAACDDSDTTQRSELVGETTEAVDETTETVDETETIDYTQISCDDELTQALSLINELRSQTQVCGTTTYDAVEALTWNDALTAAAKEHSNNMANYNFFSHTGLDDSSAGDRITAQGYTWSSYAENIAAGQRSVQSVVDGWMQSEGHCKNIMSSNVTEMGLACSINADADYTTYWTQDFTSPR